MLCCVVLCCAVLCCVVLCCAVLCCVVMCCGVVRCDVLCCAVPCCAVCCVLLCFVVLDCVLQVLTPTALWTPGPAGLYVADFGSNLAGLVQLQGVQCTAGTTITLQHGEILQHEGLPDIPDPNPKRIYTGNLRTARATDVYTCAGLPDGETWAAHFTYHGFRYVEVTVSDPKVVIAAGHLRLLHQHSLVDARAALWFPAQPTLNRLQAYPFPVPTPRCSCQGFLFWMLGLIGSDSITVRYRPLPHLCHKPTVPHLQTPNTASLTYADPSPISTRYRPIRHLLLRRPIPHLRRCFQRLLSNFWFEPSILGVFTSVQGPWLNSWRPSSCFSEPCGL